MANTKGKLLASTQSELIAATDREAAQQIEALRSQASKAEFDIANAQADAGRAGKDAANAIAAQQQVQIKLSKQQENTAAAEQSLLELTTRLAWRRIDQSTPKMAVSTLRPYAGSSVAILSVGSDPEVVDLAKSVLVIFKEAEWSVEFANTMLAAPNESVGITCFINTSVQAARALSSVCRSIPSARIVSHPLRPGLVGSITIAARPSF